MPRALIVPTTCLPRTTGVRASASPLSERANQLNSPGARASTWVTFSGSVADPVQIQADGIRRIQLVGREADHGDIGRGAAGSVGRQLRSLGIGQVGRGNPAAREQIEGVSWIGRDQRTQPEKAGHSYE